MRNAHALPRSGKRPWVVRRDFVADAIDHRFMDKIDEEHGVPDGGQPALVG